MRHIETQKVKTRKEHRCVGCGRKFPKGTEMEINKYVMNCEIRNDYWCETCQVYADRFMPGEFEIMPGELKGGEGWEEIREEVEEV